MFHAYLGGARCLGGARTVNDYALYVGEYPMCVRDRAVGPVAGEVYDVSDGMLTMLDALEEHPRLFCREEVQVRLDNDRTVTAWVYFIVSPPTGNQAGLVASGDLLDGDASRDFKS
jgi:gamma-glutamylcyclotransferase (GGCT)/AIG2-like uncharacterized protein YtfP